MKMLSPLILPAVIVAAGLLSDGPVLLPMLISAIVSLGSAMIMEFVTIGYRKVILLVAIAVNIVLVLWAAGVLT